jgi:hypothetical protein
MLNLILYYLRDLSNKIKTVIYSKARNGHFLQDARLTGICGALTTSTCWLLTPMRQMLSAKFLNSVLTDGTTGRLPDTLTMRVFRRRVTIPILERRLGETDGTLQLHKFELVNLLFV